MRLETSARTNSYLNVERWLNFRVRCADGWLIAFPYRRPATVAMLGSLAQTGIQDAVIAEAALVSQCLQRSLLDQVDG